MDIEAKGIKVLRPIRWTARAESYQRIIENYAALQSLWDKSLQRCLQDAEMRGRIIGVSAMPTLEYYFGVSIGITIFSMTDNLSKTLQKQKIVIHPETANGEVNQGSYPINAATFRNDPTFDLFYKAYSTKHKSSKYLIFMTR